MSSSRRTWLRQAALSVSALSLRTELLASPRFKEGPAGIVHMNSNENPYGPSALARQAMAEALTRSNRYPDNEIPSLKKQIADFWKVGEEHIRMGAGSSEMNGLVNLHAASLGKGHVITAETSYKVWHEQTMAQGLSIRTITNDVNRDFDLNAMLSAIDSDTRLVYLCNPNNPTGKVLQIDRLLAFVREASKKTMVLLDEAYAEYADFPTLAGEAITNPNLIVTKTFSKVYGLAGARLGYAIAQPKMISRLGSLQAWPDVSISQVTAAAGSASLKDQDFVKDCKKKNEQAKSKCYSCFSELHLDYIPSATNFILFNIDSIQADLPKAMAEHGIGVQYRNHFGGRWCRVSMGTLEETDKFCTALRSIVKG